MAQKEKPKAVILWIPHQELSTPYSYPPEFIAQIELNANKRGVEVIQGDGGRNSANKIIAPQALWRWSVLKYEVIGVVVHLDALLHYFGVTEAEHRSILKPKLNEGLRGEAMASFAKSFGLHGELNCPAEYDLLDRLRHLQVCSPLVFASDKATAKKYPCTYEALSKYGFPTVGSISEDPTGSAKLAMRYFILGEIPEKNQRRS